LNFQDGINTDVTTSNGDLGVIFGDLNGGRLPYYHRLDFNLKRTWKLKRKGSTIEANFGVTNLYNRKNIFFINRVTQERVNQLPILPSIGVNWQF